MLLWHLTYNTCEIHDKSLNGIWINTLLIPLVENKFNIFNGIRDDCFLLGRKTTKHFFIKQLNKDENFHLHLRKLSV